MRLVDPLGERPLQAADFPLTLGGAGSEVVLPALEAGRIVARITLEGSRLLVEPQGGASLLLDGRRLGQPDYLEPGAVLDLGHDCVLRVDTQDGATTLAIDYPAVRNLTLPPLLDGQTIDAALARAEGVPIEVVDYRPPSGRPSAPRRALPWSRITAIAAGIVVLAALGLLLASVTVTVLTVPDVEPDGVDFSPTPFDLRFGQRQLVLPGHYTVHVTADGYAPATMDVEVTRADGQEVRVPLQRLPGRVRVEAGDVAATLSVDGHELGTLPGEFDMAAGARELRVSAPRYEDHRESLLVTGGGVVQSVSVTLQPAFAPVTVTSIPAGAQLRVDGAEAGVTPLQATLDAGRHLLTLEHPGYSRFETTITVKSGEALEVGPIELGLPDGMLLVRTEPAGADVSVAGRYRGRSPVTLALAPGVPHEIEVSKAGYEPVTRTESLSAGRQSSMSLKLEAILGEVTVRGEPADAELFVDGVSRGAANQTLLLPAAPQQLEVRKRGLAPYIARITPKPGLPQVVEYRLTTAEQARLAQLPASVTTALGQELKLVRGGRFVIGSPRREPGRRSNESQRTVELKRPFYFGAREVTNQQFRQFRSAHASGIFKEETLDLDNQPVVRVSWQDAAAFCNWLSAKDGLPPAYVIKGGALVLADPVTTGYRLPTEAEWEFVARQDAGGALRKYPWGDALPVAARSGNYADQSAIYLTPVVISGYNDGFRVAAPVGSFAPNARGIFDLGGNVSEWTGDHYSIYVTDPDKVVVDPVGPGEGQTWVIRGASWLTGRTPDLRLAWRDGAAAGQADLGFRLARYAE